MRPLCTCGQKAHLEKGARGYYFKCTFCSRKTKQHKTKEDARLEWVANRKLRKRWYK